MYTEVAKIYGYSCEFLTVPNVYVNVYRRSVLKIARIGSGATCVSRHPPVALECLPFLTGGQLLLLVEVG